jgi:hypothetical protein
LIFSKLGEMSPEALSALEEGYACCGMRGVWQRELESAMVHLRLTYVPPYLIAVMCAKLGNKEQTLSWLERAYKERDRYMIFLARETYFGFCRSDPRFNDLLGRMNL